MRSPIGKMGMRSRHVRNLARLLATFGNAAGGVFFIPAKPSEPYCANEGVQDDKKQGLPPFPFFGFHRQQVFGYAFRCVAK